MGVVSNHVALRWAAGECVSGLMVRDDAPDDPRLNRLLACGLVRLLWDQLGAEARACVEGAEDYADHRCSREFLGSLRRDARKRMQHAGASGVYELAVAVWNLTWRPRTPPKLPAFPACRVSAVSNNVACVGQALCPGGDEQARKEGRCDSYLCKEQQAILHEVYPCVNGIPLAWVAPVQAPSPDAERIAWGAYLGRDWGALPILADALEEAGCVASMLLEHLRGPGPHGRGCWAVDYVLGLRGGGQQK